MISSGSTQFVKVPHIERFNPCPTERGCIFFVVVENTENPDQLALDEDI